MLPYDDMEKFQPDLPFILLQIDRKLFIRPDMPANQAYTVCQSIHLPLVCMRTVC